MYHCAKEADVKRESRQIVSAAVGRIAPPFPGTGPGHFCRVLLALGMALAPAVFAAAAPDRMAHVTVQLALSPALAALASGGGPGPGLHMQALVLRLDKGRVYFHDLVRLQMEKGAPAPGAVKFLLLLEEGRYLAEFLLFVPGRDDFAFLVRDLCIRAEDGTTRNLDLPVDGLSRRGFDKLRQDLVYDGTQQESVFYDHMLWMRIQRGSLRPGPERLDLFARYKLATVDIVYSPYSYRLLGRDLSDLVAGSREAPESLKRSYKKIFTAVLVDRIYHAAVLADNLECLAAAAAADFGKVSLKRLSSAAGAFKNVADDLLSRWKWDKPAFTLDLQHKGVDELKTLVVQKAGETARAVSRLFFEGYDKTAEKSAPDLSPVVYAEQLKKACQVAGDLVGKK